MEQIDINNFKDNILKMDINDLEKLKEDYNNKALKMISYDKQIFEFLALIDAEIARRNN